MSLMEHFFLSFSQCLNMAGGLPYKHEIEACLKTEENTVPFNPWLVKSFDVFLFYCCPECNFKSQLHDDFNSHAMISHPLVTLFSMFIVDQCLSHLYVHFRQEMQSCATNKKISSMLSMLDMSMKKPLMMSMMMMMIFNRA